MLQRIAYLSSAFLLTACGPVLDSNAWFVARYKSSADFLFEPESRPRQADPRPDAKGLIGRNIGSVFGRANVKNVEVSGPRPNGYGWLACVRADVVGITNQGLGIQYFVVEIDNGQIGLRRAANAADKCESETFEAI